MNRAKYIMVGLAALFVYYLPVLILGQGSCVTIHDNLDGEFIFRLLIKVPALDGMVWQPMGGVARECLQSSLNLTAMLFSWFEPFTAYVVNDVLARVTGFVGMLLLLTGCFGQKNHVAMAIALIFAMLGSYNVYGGLTVMGQPLLLWSVLQIRSEGSGWWRYVIVCGFAFCSSLFLVGVFVCVAMGVFTAWDWVIKKRLNVRLLIATALLGLSYVVVEWSFIINFFSSDAISHRSEFVLQPVSFVGAVIGTFKSLTTTQYHTGQMCTIPIIVAAAASWIYNHKIDRRSVITIWVIGVILGIGLVNIFLTRALPNVTVLTAFQWDRFYFLLPMLWLILLSLSISALWPRRVLCWALVAICGVGVLCYNCEARGNARTLLGMENREPSYEAFYDTALFERIFVHIARPESDYRVASLGIHPAVALYNGFWTVDGYMTSYPLTYKQQFRQVIAPELAKSERLRVYFDNWGSRCYLFSAELGLSYLGEKKRIDKLDINTLKLYELGCRYIFSTAMIANAAQIGLLSDGVFSGKFFTIYLYKIDD